MGQPAVDDQLAEAEIDRHREHEQEEVLRPPPRIVKKRSDYEPGDRPERPGCTPEQQIPRQYDRQEAENEDIGVEQHSFGPTISLPWSQALLCDAEQRL